MRAGGPSSNPGLHLSSECQFPTPDRLAGPTPLGAGGSDKGPGWTQGSGLAALVQDGVCSGACCSLPHLRVLGWGGWLRPPQRGGTFLLSESRGWALGCAPSPSSTGLCLPQGDACFSRFFGKLGRKPLKNRTCWGPSATEVPAQDRCLPATGEEGLRTASGRLWRTASQTPCCLSEDGAPGLQWGCIHN